MFYYSSDLGSYHPDSIVSMVTMLRSRHFVHGIYMPSVASLLHLKHYKPGPSVSKSHRPLRHGTQLLAHTILGGFSVPHITRISIVCTEGSYNLISLFSPEAEPEIELERGLPGRPLAILVVERHSQLNQLQQVHVALQQLVLIVRGTLEFTDGLSHDSRKLSVL